MKPLAGIIFLLLFATAVMAEINGNNFARDQRPIVYPAMTASGNSETIRIGGQWSTAGWFFRFDTVDADDTILVWVEGSVDGTEWAPLTLYSSSTGYADTLAVTIADTTRTILRTFSDLTSVPYVRHRVVSDSTFALDAKVFIGE